jgi:hypothetical protein
LSENVDMLPAWKSSIEKQADQYAIDVLLPLTELLDEGERYDWDLPKLEMVF